MNLPALTQWWPGGGGGETPDLRPGLEESDITPGIAGFLFTALMAFLLVVVVRDLVKRMRRMKYRSQLDEDLDADEAEFPGEVTPAEISESQLRAREAAAAQRFGTPAEPEAAEGADPAEDAGTVEDRQTPAPGSS